MSATIETGFPLIYLIFAALLMTFYTGIAMQRPLKLFTKICFLLGFTGTSFSIIALLGIVFARFDVPYLRFAIFRFPDLFGLPRVSSFFGNPNTFGIFMFFCMAATLVLFIMQRSRGANNRVSAILLCSSLILQFSALFLTFSRAAFLALALFATFFLWFTARRLSAIPPLFLITGVLFKGKALINGEGIAEKILLLLSGRADLWHEALKLFVKYPLLGVGPGGWITASGQMLPVHNTYLHIAVELGVVALLAYLASIIAVLYWLWTALGKTERGSSRFILLSGLFSLSLGVFAHQFFESHLYQGFPLYLFYIIAILFLAQKPKHTPYFRPGTLPGGLIATRGKPIDLATFRQLILTERTTTRKAG